MRAVVYVRISRDRDGSELGVRRQEPPCRALCEANGWEVVEVIADNDTSAYKGRRPGYERLCDGLRAGTWQAVVAWHPDRLHRSPRELEDFIDLIEQTGCEVATAKAGAWDLATAAGRMMARQLGVIARYESEHRSERIRAKHDELAKAGKWAGGTRPYGYRPEDGRLIVDQDEADKIREAADRVLGGESVGAVCADWNRREVPTVKGAPWRTQTLRRILTEAAVAGRRSHKGREVDAEWAPILDNVTHKRLQRLVNDPARSRAAPAPVALLAGLATCGECRTKLITARRESGARVYICPPRARGGCGGVQVVAGVFTDPTHPPGLEDYIVEEMLTYGQNLVAESDPPAGEEVSARLAELEETRLDIIDRIARRELPTQTLVDFTAAADRETAELFDRAAPVMRPDLAEWDGWDLAERQRAVRLYLADVVVGRALRRGPGFDAERVEVHWL